MNNSFIIFHLSYANVRDRNLGKWIFSTILDPAVQREYIVAYESNSKGADQMFLSEYIWPKAKKNSTVHDSYNCGEFGGDPFPTQRPNDKFCFVACFLPCCIEDVNDTRKMPECPIACRPQNNQDWKYC